MMTEPCLQFLRADGIDLHGLQLEVTGINILPTMLSLSLVDSNLNCDEFQFLARLLGCKERPFLNLKELDVSENAISARIILGTVQTLYFYQHVNFIEYVF